MDSSIPPMLGHRDSANPDSPMVADESPVPSGQEEGGSAAGSFRRSRGHAVGPFLPRPQAFRLRAAPAGLGLGLGLDSHVVRVLCPLFLREPLTLAQARRLSLLRYEECRVFIAHCAQIGLVEVFTAPPPAAMPVLQRLDAPAGASTTKRSFILPAQDHSVAMRQRALARHA